MATVTATTTTKLFLDDMRTPPVGWTLTTTVSETISMLEGGGITHLSLDHDLGDVPETGYDVLMWLEREVFVNGFVPPQVIKIHSDNASARVKMELAVKSIFRFC